MSVERELSRCRASEGHQWGNSRQSRSSLTWGRAMTRRLIIEQTEIRSETFQTRFDLSIDDPPSDSRTTAPPVAPRAIRVPRLSTRRRTSMKRSTIDE